MKLSLLRMIIIGVALYVAFFAVKYALANISYLKVDAYLERWHKNEQLTDEELADALKAANTMLALHGHFPHYLNVAAKVHEWKAYKHNQEPDVYNQSLADALALYQESVEVRLHWPLTWSSMANIKANLNQFDDDFYHYYQQAIKFGPYMSEVNVELSKIKLRNWNQMQGESTKLALEQIKRALLNNKARWKLLKYSKSINKHHVVCTVGRLNKIKQVSNNRVCKQK
ncbi:MAG: hypothetical protein GY951_10640 [Psychromonas sp.]|nr:hypothetical protein [Psychromonas sp.]